MSFIKLKIFKNKYDKKKKKKYKTFSKTLVVFEVIGVWNESPTSAFNQFSSTFREQNTNKCYNTKKSAIFFFFL